MNLNGPWWNDNRREVLRLLSDLDQSLAAMYELAINLLNESPSEGRERARFSNVGHCFREILNNLPEALNDVPGVPERGHDDGKNARQLAAGIGDALGSSVDAADVAAGGVDLGTRTIKAPKTFFDAMAEFAREHGEVEKRVARRDSASVLGRVDPEDPSLVPWTAARKFFMRRTHLNLGTSTKKPSAVPPDAEVQVHVSNVEASIVARLGPFYGTVDSFQDILQVANRRRPDSEGNIVDASSQSYYAPTTAELHAALARLTTLQFRRAFFSKLENPLWVAPLHKKRWFSNPPAIERLDDQSYRVDPWPEINYLVKMAPMAPQEVGSALLAAAKTDNPWVRRGIWEASTHLPAASVAPLAPEMLRWATDDLGNSRTDQRDIARVIVILLTEGQHKAGARLADRYYTPRQPEDDPKLGRVEPVASIEPYSYAETLPAVAGALGTGQLRTLRRWLEEYQVASKSYDPQTQEDTSYIWRPIVAGSSSHHAHKIGEGLIETLRAAAFEAGAAAPRSLNTLFKSEQPLLRRIGVDVLSDLLDAVQISDDEDQPTKARRSELFTRASAVIEDASYVENAYRPEFVKLVRASARWGAAIDMAPLAAAIELGAPALHDERRTRFSREGDTPEEMESRARDYSQSWQHTLLSAIGSGSLTGSLADLLNALSELRGPIDNPNEPPWQVHSFTGPTSPLDEDQVSAMSDDDLLAQLASWHPDPSEWAGPTHEGQGRAVTESLKNQAGRLADRAYEVEALRPTYVRAIMRGWQLAHEAGGDLPWKEIVDVCLWAVALNDDTVVVSEGHDFDDDVNYRNLKFQVLQLLEAGLNKGIEPEGSPIPLDLIPSVEAAISRLAEHAEPTVEYEAKYGGDNMDPSMLSLNTIRPVAIRALIKLVHRHPNTVPADAALVSLEAHLGDADPSLAVAATYGRELGRLYDSVHDWTLDHVTEIFGSEQSADPKQQIAFSTALASNGYHPALLKTLRLPILRSLRRLPTGEQAAGWRGLRSFEQLLGDWILLASLTGSIELDDQLMVEWLRNADASLKGDVLGHLGWQMMHWTQIDDDLLRRSKEFWDYRVEHVRSTPADAAELSGFYWFVRSGKVGADWWLPRLLEVVSQYADFKTHGMVGDALAEAGSQDPDTALAILEILMARARMDDLVSSYDLYENAIPRVLATALDTGLPELVQRANDLMNQLGAGGFIDVQDRVRSRRKPKS